MRNKADWILWGDWLEQAPSILKKAGYASRPMGNRGTKQEKRNIINLPCALDIETSRFPSIEQSYIYHWQCQIGFDSPTIYGRTVDSLREFLTELADLIGSHNTLVMYVHNLSYEFAWLKGIYKFGQDEVFAVQSRKVLKCTMFEKRLEFRCSYLLTNKSLAAWTKEFQVEHRKQSSDDYDHDRIRTPFEDMTDDELEYCQHDVLGLCEALTAQMERDADTLVTIPLTSTGYVRRDVKRAMRLYSRWALMDMQPDEDVYRALRQAFRGGDTHCNRYYAGAILEDVHSMDRSSSYPDVVCNFQFPMSKFRRAARCDLKEVSRLQRLNRALLIRIRFHRY